MNKIYYLLDFQWNQWIFHLLPACLQSYHCHSVIWRISHFLFMNSKKGSAWGKKVNSHFFYVILSSLALLHFKSKWESSFLETRTCFSKTYIIFFFLQSFLDLNLTLDYDAAIGSPFACLYVCLSVCPFIHVIVALLCHHYSSGVSGGTSGIGGDSCGTLNHSLATFKTTFSLFPMQHMCFASLELAS